jgi:cytochrome c oxidase subunit 4
MADGHKIVPLKNYVYVLAILVALTALTVGVARPVTGMDFGFLNTFIALLIATIKASLVLAIFMQLKYDSKLYLVITLTGLFFVILLFAFTCLDIYSRVVYQSPL